MTNSKKDENGRQSIIGVSQTVPTTIVKAVADPTTHLLLVEDGSTGSNNGNNNGVALLDENSAPVLMACSSAGDGTLVEVYMNPVTGAILVDSN